MQMNLETLQILIEPRTDARECMNANTHTISLRSKDSNSMYQCEIALPCTDSTVCELLAEFITFPMTTLNHPLNRMVGKNEYHSWIERMQSALSEMRSVENLAKDLETLGISYEQDKLQLVKYLKNKYQFGLKETKILVDIYFATL